MALLAATARAAHQLGKQLESAFVAAEIGHREQAVGPHDDGQGEPLEIETLGDHLGADQDVDAPFREVADHFLFGRLAFRRVGVEPGDGPVREGVPQFFLEFFRAGAALHQGRFAAGRAAQGEGAVVPAVMAG